MTKLSTCKTPVKLKNRNTVSFFFFFWLRWVFVAPCGLFSSCGEQGLLFIAVRGLLIAVASLVAELGF